jgi:hypothetical protein
LPRINSLSKQPTAARCDHRSHTFTVIHVWVDCELRLFGSRLYSNLEGINNSTLSHVDLPLFSTYRCLDKWNLAFKCQQYDLFIFCRSPLWLIGLDAPIIQETYFKMSTNSKKNIDVHLDILYSFTKFCKKNIYYLWHV